MKLTLICQAIMTCLPAVSHAASYSLGNSDVRSLLWVGGRDPCDEQNLVTLSVGGLNPCGKTFQMPWESGDLCFELQNCGASAPQLFIWRCSQGKAASGRVLCVSQPSSHKIRCANNKTFNQDYACFF